MTTTNDNRQRLPAAVNYRTSAAQQMRMAAGHIAARVLAEDESVTKEKVVDWAEYIADWIRTGGRRS